MRHVPWHVRGVRPEARDVARDAAHRAGLSVGEWLDSLIIDAAADEDSAVDGYGEPASYGPGARSHPSRMSEMGFAAIRWEIDELKRHVDRLAKGNARPSAASDRGATRATHLSESIGRVERQLDGLSRTAGASHPAPDRDLWVDDAFAEISARQEYLDTEPAEAPPPSGPAADLEAPRPSFDPSVFEQHIRDIGERIAALQTAAQVANPPQPQHSEDISESLRQQFAEFRSALKDAPPPIDEIAKVWRQDLADISAALRNAMPTSAIAALEGQVRALDERLAAHRGEQATTPATAAIEQALTDIRDRLQSLTPAEELAELSQAVKLLTRKADAIAESAPPEKMKQLEQAIGALQGLAAQVASQDVVAGLSRDIKALSEKIDRSNRPAVDAEFMSALDRRLAEIAEAAGRSRPAEGASISANFEAVIKSLADRLEATQIPAADHGALKHLEQRIVTLVDKLENSEARLDRQDDPDRGMTELMAQLKELRAQNENKLQAIQQQLVTSATEAISGPAESIRRDVASLKEIQSSADRRTQDTFEAVYGTIEQVVDRLASIEVGIRDGRVDQPAMAWDRHGEQAADRMPSAHPLMTESPAIVPSATPTAARATSAPGAEPTAARSRMSVSDLPPDAPLEPGSGARRVRVVANAIDRIAASEAAIGTVKPADAASPMRANFVAAARRAAQAVASENDGAQAAGSERSAPGAKQGFEAGALLAKLKPRIKSVVLGISVIMLVLGALRLALDALHNPKVAASVQPITRIDDTAEPSGQSIPPAPESPPTDQPPPGKGASLVPTTSPRPGSANTLTETITTAQMPASGVLPDVAAPALMPRPAVAQAPAAIPAALASVPDAVVTSTIRNPLLQGSANRDAVSQTATAPAPPARDLTLVPLPPTLGGKALIGAAAAGDPGASYEIAIRFAEGRSVGQDLTMAAAWFDRAARSGLAPAQFRLGSMYEKGLGVKKDLAEARRLYLAAADKGNAKAMHNLAVLYSEGLDGKPDYATASQWFRKAAAYGVVDSQYNLAILYARGVGVERNAAESYKWFALAAKGGDKDAARKRDEIATRLDAKQLESARLNVESFMVEPQPDEATATRAPAGGWDQVVAAVTPKSKGAR